MKSAESIASDPDPDLPPGAVTARRRYPRSARLRSSAEIRSMFKSRERVSSATLDLFFANSTENRNPRFAIVVPKHKHTIVERNRLKRRLREILRTRWLPDESRRESPRDLLVRAKPSAYKSRFEELETELSGMLEVEQC
jgi:ribonuclease P protein component